MPPLEFSSWFNVIELFHPSDNFLFESYGWTVTLMAWLTTELYIELEGSNVL